MDLLVSLPTFLVAVVLISASPGPAMALIVRRAALRGFRASVPTVLGLEAGLYVWAILAGAGLAAVVAASAVAYTVLRIVGATVLLVLGLQAWCAAWRSRRDGAAIPRADQSAPSPPRWKQGWRAALSEGAIVQLANPKAAVFMFAFYPQFVPDDRPLLATTAGLAAVQVVVETGLYLALAASVGRAGAWFQRPRIRRRFEALSGIVLVALGLRVAASSR
jgi:threonine/homoserine/homoserine lactone efflux protein